MVKVVQNLEMWVSHDAKDFGGYLQSADRRRKQIDERTIARTMRPRTSPSSSSSENSNSQKQTAHQTKQILRSTSCFRSSLSKATLALQAPPCATPSQHKHSDKPSATHSADRVSPSQWPVQRPGFEMRAKPSLLLRNRHHCFILGVHAAETNRMDILDTDMQRKCLVARKALRVGVAGSGVRGTWRAWY